MKVPWKQGDMSQAGQRGPVFPCASGSKSFQSVPTLQEDIMQSCHEGFGQGHSQAPNVAGPAETSLSQAPRGEAVSSGWVLYSAVFPLLKCGCI